MAALISFSDFVGFPLNCFKVFGVTPQETNQTSKVKRIFLEIWRFLAFFTLTIPSVLMINFIRENRKNLSLIAESAAPNGYLFLAFVKTIFIFRKRKCFKRILGTLSDMFPKSIEEQKIFKVVNYLKSYKRIERFVTLLIGFASFNFVAVKFANFALFGTWYEKKLPVENWFPFDKYDPVWYNFVILWTILFSIFFNGGLIGSDLILYSFVTLITLQYEILSEELENMKAIDGKEMFDELIKQHQKLLEVSRDLEEVFSPSILVNFVASSILICMFGYQILVEFNLELLFKFASPLTASVLQILMICRCGQMLTEAAGKLTFSAYNSDWSSDQKKLKTSLVLMMQKSQQPSVITAGKFRVVSFEAFAAVSDEVF
jgi:odorant receptor